MSDPFEETVNRVEQNTLINLFPSWMSNWTENLYKARQGESLDKLYQKGPVSRVLIVGRGPSLRKNRHVEYLADNPFPGPIISSDGALPLLAEHGLTPYLSITVDGSTLIQRWYDDALVEKISSTLHAVLPVTVHPHTVTACEKRGIPIYWFIPEMDIAPYLKGVTETLQLQTRSPENPTGLSRLNGAGCSGLCSLVIAAIIMRAKEIVLVGMDNGYPTDTPIDELHYHKNILASGGFNDVEAAKLYKIIYVPVWGEYCILDPVFEIYRRVFTALSQQLMTAGVKLVNCTQGGVLVNDGVQCMTLDGYYKVIKQNSV